MKKITVTEGLNELKLFDARIQKLIQTTSLVGAAKSKDPTVGTVTKEKFSATAKACDQAINDLIENRARLKAAIVASNAITRVKVGEVEMTVAEAIERKTAIKYEQAYLQQMKLAYEAASSRVLSMNAQVNAQIDKLLETAYGKDDAKKTQEVYDSIAKPYHAANDWSLVDPLNLADKIKALEAKIDDFLSHVDTALAVANATTVIEY